MENKLKLSPPWTTYYRQLKALFGKDPDIKLFFDEEEGAVKFFVYDRCKEYALQKLLPKEESFGNVTVKILIEGPEGEPVSSGNKTLWEDAFEGNPVVSKIEAEETPFSSRSLVYIGFVKEVVQFFNDDLSDPHGNCSTLYQEIAKEIFKDMLVPDVYFYTVNEDYL